MGLHLCGLCTLKSPKGTVFCGEVTIPTTPQVDGGWAKDG